MKIRQKIAMLLAAAMTLTAVPMVTMAKSDNSLTQGIQTAEKDKPVANGLKLEMKDATSNPFMFFVNLTNAEFIVGETQPVTLEAGANVGVSYTTVKDGKEMKVVVTPTLANSKGTFVLPIGVNLKGGDATVAVDAAGSSVSDMSPVIFARTSDAKANVTVGDAETIYADGKKVGKITIEEPFINILGSKTIKFTIKHSDYKFVLDSNGVPSTSNIKAEKGFDTVNLAASQWKSEDSDSVLVFTPSVTKTTSTPGRLTFEFELKSTAKKPATGKLEIKVSGDNISDATVLVGEVKDYGTAIEMKDKKVVDVTAGKKEDITFTIKEVVANTFMTGRDFDVEFEKGYLSPIEDPNAAQEKLIKADIQGKIKNDDVNFAVTDLIKDADDFVVGFTATGTPKVVGGGYDAKDQAEIKVEDLTVYVALGTSGDVTVKASGRALGYDASAVAINAKEAVSVTSDPMTIKVGLKEQMGGKVVIKEADKGIFEQGEYIFLNLEDNAGLELKDEDFAKNGKIEVTSGDAVLDLGATKVYADGVLAIKVKRSSTVASTITIKDLKVYTDRTLPQGNFDIEIGGRAIATAWTLIEDANISTVVDLKVEAAKDAIKKVKTVKPMKVEKFIIVATPNTEDLTSNGLKKGTASFVIGSAKFVSNGIETAMDGTVYNSNGRTMVPVRYVVNALGVEAKDIYFANGTVTVIAGAKTISLKIGSKTAMLNGAPARTMVVAPVMKDGRVYVPVSELGALLGVTATWDAATQTATFTS